MTNRKRGDDLSAAHENLLRSAQPKDRREVLAQGRFIWLLHSVKYTDEAVIEGEEGLKSLAPPTALLDAYIGPYEASADIILICGPKY